MAWWQVLLILLGSIVVGVALGYAVFYIIVKTTGRARTVPTVRMAVRTTPPTGPTAVRTAPPTEPSPAPAPKPAEARPPQPPSVADLIAEVEANRRVASGTWDGKLQQFQTRAWDNRGDEVHALPADLRVQLAEAYSDMSLANSIVWLATEMGRRSESLNDSYVKLRSSIAGRLDQIHSRFGADSRPVSPA